MKFEYTFNTEKAENIHIDVKILKRGIEALTMTYNSGGKKCCTALYVGTHFFKRPTEANEIFKMYDSIKKTE